MFQPKREIILFVSFSNAYFLTLLGEDDVLLRRLLGDSSPWNRKISGKGEKSDLSQLLPLCAGEDSRSGVLLNLVMMLKKREMVPVLFLFFALCPL